MPVGELFILGFFGKTIPAWLREFAGRYGLGGVILFDYSCQTQNTTTTLNHLSSCSVSARRFRACRRIRWCSSIRNAAAALEISDRGYVIETGRIAFSNKASALLSDPKVKNAYLGFE